MGFYINEFDNELKQHINLSDTAWIVIYEDINNLHMKNTKESFSGFLNRIFFNFHQKAFATISQRCQEYKEKLYKLIDDNSTDSQCGCAIDSYISRLVYGYEVELIQASRSYPKGEGRKFRVNKQNLELLRLSPEANYYDSIGQYMKAVFEEYAQKPTYEREQIYYKETVDKINSAIAQSLRLKIAIPHNRYGEISRRQFYITPYKLMQDKVRMYNYLVGFSEELMPNGSMAEKVVSSIRVSKIEKISIMSSMPAFISKASKTVIDREILKKTPQYMLGDVVDVKVKFKPSGVVKLKNRVYMRPAIYEKLSDDTYVFHCTMMQATNYFFKFGSDAVVLEPKELRDQFVKWYNMACSRYAELDEKSPVDEDKA